MTKNNNPEGAPDDSTIISGPRCSELNPELWQYSGGVSLLIHQSGGGIKLFDCDWTDGTNKDILYFKPVKGIIITYDESNPTNGPSSAVMIDSFPSPKHAITSASYTQAWIYESLIIDARLQRGMSVKDIAMEALETVFDF